MRQFLCFDTEATGLQMADTDLSQPSGLRRRGDEVCQIGGLLLNENMEPQKIFCHYCDTVAVECSKGAIAVHGIEMKEVRKHLPSQFLPVVLHDRVPEFFYPDMMFIGYNVEFDMNMVKQTLSNSDVPFDWSPLRGSIVPKHGRISIDVSPYFKHIGNAAKGDKSYFRKLSSFEKELAPLREQFFRQYGHLPLETNCMEMLAPTWEQAHNSFFDALNTFLLWRERVWRKKLI